MPGNKIKPEKCQCILVGTDGTIKHSKELSDYIFHIIGGSIKIRPCKNHEEIYRHSRIFERFEKDAKD